MREAEAAFAALPPAHERCTVSVALPARNECETIGATLEALADQRLPEGRPLDPATFEVVIFANDCTDGTAARVRAFALERPSFAVYVAEARLPPDANHIGHVRRAAMNAAVLRLQPAGARGVVASTDADTRVSPEWIAQIAVALRGAEAVGGRVLPALADDVARPSDALAYALEHRYQYAVVRLETLLDPVSHDPWPRHGNHQGASFALFARAYTCVGGTPAVPVLEDFALYDALLAAGMRFRHSLRVRVATSGRRSGRVIGGFASHLQRIDEHVAGRTEHLVEDPRETFARFRGRGALRREDTVAAAQAYGVARDAIARHLREAPTVGSAIETIERAAHAHGTLRGRTGVPIEVAIRVLDDYRCVSPASVACPTRINA